MVVCLCSDATLMQMFNWCDKCEKVIFKISLNIEQFDYRSGCESNRSLIRWKQVF